MIPIITTQPTRAPTYSTRPQCPPKAPMTSDPSRDAMTCSYTPLPVLDDDLDITGPVRVKLFASTSARDTDFWAQLVDVFPNGYSMHLTEGIIRARYRNSLEKPELLEPDRVYEFDIDLWVTSNIFQRGHRVRLGCFEQFFSKI